MKFRRAKYQFGCLKLAYARLRDANLRLGPHHLHLEPGENPLLLPRIQPNARWGVMIGDCVQNLRASLDHAVFQLVPAPIRDVYVEKITFPIYDDAAKYQRWKGKHANWLAAIDGEALAVIDGLQPCDRGNAPRSHILWKLHRLSNIDKHRSIHVAGLGIRAISSSRGFVVLGRNQRNKR